MLYVSRRNCRTEFSHGSEKFFSNAISQLLRPGPCKLFRPIYPNIPGSPSALNCGRTGIEIVDGSNHCSVGPNTGLFAMVFETAKSPTVLHFMDFPIPLRFPLWLHVKFTGIPVKKLLIPLSCHPPSPFFRKRLL